MYDSMQGKYETSLFQIWKAFRNFGVNSTIRKKIYWVLQLLGNKVIEKCLLTSPS